MEIEEMSVQQQRANFRGDHGDLSGNVGKDAERVVEVDAERALDAEKKALEDAKVARRREIAMSRAQLKIDIEKAEAEMAKGGAAAGIHKLAIDLFKKDDKKLLKEYDELDATMAPGTSTRM